MLWLNQLALAKGECQNTGNVIRIGPKSSIAVRHLAIGGPEC
jgi:hypothetical protein